MGLVRTDSQALTLDRFLNQGMQQKSQMTKLLNSSDVHTVVPVQLISVKKLIHQFENDRDDQM